MSQGDGSGVPLRLVALFELGGLSGCLLYDLDGERVGGSGIILLRDRLGMLLRVAYVSQWSSGYELQDARPEDFSLH